MVTIYMLMVMSANGVFVPVKAYEQEAQCQMSRFTFAQKSKCDKLRLRRRHDHQ